MKRNVPLTPAARLLASLEARAPGDAAARWLSRLLSCGEKALVPPAPARRTTMPARRQRHA